MNANAILRKATAPRLELAEQRRQRWSYIAEIGCQVTDLLQPEFWSALHMKLQPWDQIEVAEEGGAWYAELLVRSSTAAGVIVSGLRAVQLDGMGPRDFVPLGTDAYSIVYKGPFLKWAVCERATDKELRSGFRTEQDAAAWLANHLRVSKQ